MLSEREKINIYDIDGEYVKRTEEILSKLDLIDTCFISFDENGDEVVCDKYTIKDKICLYEDVVCDMSDLLNLLNKDRIHLINMILKEKGIDLKCLS